jgi:hypothetical protein
MNARRFPRLATFAWACALVAGLAPSASAEIVYTMTDASDLQNDWALAGTITLSGTGTDLGSAAITGWAYTVTKGPDSYTYSSNDSNAFVGAFGLLATPTLLIVPYPSEGLSSPNNLQLMGRGGEVSLRWLTGLVGEGSDGLPSQYAALDNPSDWWYVEYPAFPLEATEGWVIGTASPSAVPEIDPAGIGSVLALVTGALGLLERRRLKTA